MKTVANVALALGVAIATPVYAQDAGNTNMEILLQKVKADKKLLVASNMGLSDAEGQNFWPLYDAYQKELEEINQRLDRAINEYGDADNAGEGRLANETATNLLNAAATVEEERVAVRRRYDARVSSG